MIGAQVDDAHEAHPAPPHQRLVFTLRFETNQVLVMSEDGPIYLSEPLRSRAERNALLADLADPSTVVPLRLGPRAGRIDLADIVEVRWKDREGVVIETVSVEHRIRGWGKGPMVVTPAGPAPTARRRGAAARAVREINERRFAAIGHLASPGFDDERAARTQWVETTFVPPRAIARFGLGMSFLIAAVLALVWLPTAHRIAVGIGIVLQLFELTSTFPRRFTVGSYGIVVDSITGSELISWQLVEHVEFAPIGSHRVFWVPVGTDTRIPIEGAQHFGERQVEQFRAACLAHSTIVDQSPGEAQHRALRRRKKLVIENGGITAERIHGFDPNFVKFGVPLAIIIPSLLFLPFFLAL